MYRRTNKKCNISRYLGSTQKQPRLFKLIWNKYISWKRGYKTRQKYGTTSRLPFFELAYEFIPTKKNPIIIDVGAGDGTFAKLIYARLKINPVLLDANKTTLKSLKQHFPKVIFYKAPHPLPFGSASVDFIHCSHLIEHLAPGECYSLLREFDRVVKQNGIICISAPLLWRNFYHDLSHIKPYYPETIIKYMSYSNSENYTRPPINKLYQVVKLVYRYDIIRFNTFEGFGSTFKVIDLSIQIIKKILLISGCCFFSRSGYTLILKKTGNRPYESKYN